MKIRRMMLSGVLLLVACTSPANVPAPRPTPTPVRFANAGFDTSIYPGETAMRAWRGSSPYSWVGYYLSAPCHRDASWMGSRTSLERMGWGTAIIYVGQQAFEGPPPADTIPPERILCSRTLLTAQRGRMDASDAANRAAAEGFAPGSVIFLDVEPMAVMPDSMVIYYQAWYDQLLADGRYRPGTYAHRSNAPALYGIAQTAYLRVGRREMPPFWISGGVGFGLDRPPVASGFPFATVWQGILDVTRSYGGYSLRIDENVASNGSPSGAARNGEL